MKKCVCQCLLAAVTMMAAPVWSQTTAAPPAAIPRPARAGISGTVRGVVKDDTGGAIPGATVILTDQSGRVIKDATTGDGTYVIRGIPPGTYSLTTGYSGLKQAKPIALTVDAGQSVTGDVVMTLQSQKQEVTVTDNEASTVTTDASENASALVLKQEDLDALPDDPDDLAADLQALAGPAAGPGGNQIYIDGFTGGQLPPKASIREIRINSNPFSAEYDKLGFGRIQIFTKPGTDKFHGQAYYNISDGVWNSRNPYLLTSPPFRTQMFGGNVSGPINSHASFFVDAERRQIDDNGIITATIPTASLLGSQSYQNFYATPQRRTTASPRIDYQLNSNNTLSMRYNYLLNDRVLTNIGGFSLPQTTVGNLTFPSNGYGQRTSDNEFQVVETAALNPNFANESRFQYERTNASTTSSSTNPALNVGQSFVAGGSGYSSVPNAVNSQGYGSSYSLENYYEFQNYTTATVRAHTLKFGARLRATSLDDLSPLNFNGTYSFLGSSGMTSIQQYLMTEQLLQQGLSAAAVTAMGYGPSKFVISQGNPLIRFSQIDFSPFIQDDWRFRPNLTLSFGLRYEGQTNIGDRNDWAPRFGFAWAPGGKGTNGRPKTVVRGGWGMFYDRFAINNVEQAYRSTLVNQYTVYNPATYDAAFSAAAIPSLSQLTAGSQQHYIIDNNLRAPRLMQTVLGIDRQLFSKTTVSLNFMNSRGTHELLTNDINAPVPILGELPPGATGGAFGERPYGNIGDLYDYQSVGIFKQTQVMVNFNSAIGKWFSLFGRYQYSQAHSNTDGLTTVPSNPYNITQDWGRSSLDIHHTLFMGGSITAKWKVRFSPFMVIRTGIPFNVTTGTDLYSIGATTPTARPEVSQTALTGFEYNSRLGLYVNPNPAVGTPLIGRNYGTGPGFIGLNMRVSKTFGFGTTKFQGQVGGARAGGGGGHGPGGFGGMFGGDSTEHRYNLTVSVNARNFLNHENLNTPNGSLTSPYFYQSTGITGGFGAESTASNQRRLDLQLRFAF